MGKKPFPWLLSNLLNTKTNMNYAPGIEYLIKELNGLKVIIKIFYKLPSIINRKYYLK